MLFVAFWLLFNAFIGRFDSFNKPPMGVHQSAQCDRLSLAQNYYYNGFRFFYPEVNENRCIDGIVSCEFPLMSYLAAGLFKIGSYNELYFRLLSFLVFSFGIYALFLLLLRYFNPFISLALIGLFNASPIVLFYANNFLPDIASLGLALCAWYFFFKGFVVHSYLPAQLTKTDSLLFCVTLSLSIAIKTTSMIQWLTLFFVGFIALLFPSKFKIQAPKTLITLLIISLVLPLSWYFWSQHLGKIHNSAYFLMQIPDFTGWNDYFDDWHVYLANWPSQTFTAPVIYVLFGLLILNLFLYPVLNKTLWLISSINTLGTLAFLSLMIHQFKYHDYYVLCLLPAFFLNWISLGTAIKQLKPQLWFIKISTIVLLLVGLNYQFNFGKRYLKERYTQGNYWEQSHINAFDYGALKTQLNAIGINRKDCVMVGYDISPNNILYYLHLNGFRFFKDQDERLITENIALRHPNILISNSSDFEQQVMPYVKGLQLVHTYKNIRVYNIIYP